MATINQNGQDLNKQSDGEGTQADDSLAYENFNAAAFLPGSDGKVREPTDLELTCLAALAAGYTWKTPSQPPDDSLWVLCVYKDEQLVTDIWWPLRDGHHALNLAVDIRLDIQFQSCKGKPETLVSYTPAIPHDEDGHAATRRAVVMGAAAVALFEAQ